MSFEKENNASGIKSIDPKHAICYGAWTNRTIVFLEESLERIKHKTSNLQIINGEKITILDTAGALLLYQFIRKLEYRGQEITLEGFKEEHKSLIELVSDEELQISKEPTVKIVKKANSFEVIGHETIIKLLQIKEYFTFIGLILVNFYKRFLHPREILIRGIISSIEDIGFRAMPIIALLSFLIGVVLAYQLGNQLQLYGANAYVVNLIGVAILREFGPLITAIIAAGRTSSAITAQIGTMKVNEEIDALITMGFSPIEVLVLPKIIGALIAIPLLMVWADIFGVLGGMFMTRYFFGTNYGDFLMRFQDVIDLNTFMVGFSKAPAFALIVAAVGCFQGLKVGMDADSVGKQTTKSVVQALFIIIIVDAIYSVIYSKLHI